jgi:hypothetical protein
MLAELFMLRLEAMSRENARMTGATNTMRFVPLGSPPQTSGKGSTAPASGRQTATD